MKRFLSTIALLCLFVFLPIQIWGATHYVAQTAAGRGDGSSYVNRMSVDSHNTSSFKAGDTIYLCNTIKSGVRVPSSGISGNEITYRGDYREHAGILTYYGSTGAFSANGKDYLIIDGLEIKDGKIGMAFRNGCDYVTIKNCIVHNMTGKGSKGIQVTSNTSPPTRNSNFIIGGAEGDGNTVYDCGIDTGGLDIGLAHTDNLTVSYNQCYGGGTATGIDGITLNYCDVGVIEYNRIYDHIKSDGAQFGEDGIDSKGSSNIHIRYNVIYGNRAGGIGVINSDAMKANSSNIHIYHNLIYGNKANIVVSDLDENVYIWGNVIYDSTGGHGISCTPTGSNIHIYNNTLVNNHGAKGDKWAIVIASGSDYYIKNNIFYSDTHNDLILKASAATNVNLDYNHYYYTGGAARIYWNGAYITLTKLKAFGQEVNGQEGDPLFTNVGDHDYTLQVSSPCKDTGTDSVGAIYADGLDLGGTEWSTAPCTIKTTKQGDYGSWEKGAYIYTGSQLLKSPTLKIE